MGEGASSLSGSQQASILSLGAVPQQVYLPHIASDCIHFPKSTYASCSLRCLCALCTRGTVPVVQYSPFPGPTHTPFTVSVYPQCPGPSPAHLCLVSNCLQLCSHLLWQCLLSAAAPAPAGPTKQLQVGRLTGSQGRCHDTAGSRAHQWAAGHRGSSGAIVGGTVWIGVCYVT